MKRSSAVVAVLLAAPLALAGCSGETEASYASADQWCTDYRAVLDMNAEPIGKMLENPADLTPDQVAQVVAVVDQEMSMMTSGNADTVGVISPEMLDMRMAFDEQVIQPLSDELAKGADMPDGVRKLNAGKAYADAVLNAERIAKEYGFESAEEAGESFTREISNGCGFNPSDVIQTTPNA